ncbi:MAG: hypothetical protein ACYCPN_06775 [Thermoplasmata archaeon]
MTPMPNLLVSRDSAANYQRSELETLSDGHGAPTCRMIRSVNPFDRRP